MQEDKHQALVIDAYGGEVQLRTVDRPKPAHGQLLVKVAASTINPSDLIFLSGGYFKRDLPAVCGIEGTGEVIGAGEESLNHWIGKRVSFCSPYGSWCEYSICFEYACLEIAADVDEQTAASGIVNPVTVLGFIDVYRKRGFKGGIIHTSGSSNLGKMLNRLCKAENVPLMAIVRRQESADVMLKEGITDSLSTCQAGWEDKLKAVVAEKKYDCLFDALGGGPILDKIISCLQPTSGIYIYGVLEGKPFTITDLTLFFQGIQINGFLLFPWLMSLNEEEKAKFKADYNKYIKTELSSKNGLTVSMSEIKQGLRFAKENPADGKALIKIGK